MKFTRRKILKYSLISSASLSFSPIGNSAAAYNIFASEVADSTALQSEINLANNWEGLNPGFWRIEGKGLRRALTAVGHRARHTGFPFHYESQADLDGFMPVKYDPSMPMTTLWNRNWKLEDDYALEFKARIEDLTAIQKVGDDPAWQMYQEGNGIIGVALGGGSQFESFYPSRNAAPIFILKENGEFGLMRYTDIEPVSVSEEAVGRVNPLVKGDEIFMSVSVANNVISAHLRVNGRATKTVTWQSDSARLAGYIGLVSRGLLDVTVDELLVTPHLNKPLNAPLNDCHVCYPLGDSLTETDDGWVVRFMSIFRTPGDLSEIRVSDRENPEEGWRSVAVAGNGAIISNDFRENTAVIDVLLPKSPADSVLYFTVWKDGVDVTSDPRIGTDSVGAGTGLVGDVPTSGRYVGRLPQLTAPYKMCGLSCHAITTSARSELPDSEGAMCFPSVVGETAGDCGVAQPFYVHDQPCYEAFKHLDDYNFQIMLWEDDIWYMELLTYPPSTRDAYKVVTTSIAGPTSRWQMMRHWNVLNPGDHDHGMDDVKGPEQLLIRNTEGLGQDTSYMVRNFQIVSHLMTGKENPTGKDNPKRWRKWKMPNRDFSLLVMDSRLWRTSQDTAIWADEGWGHNKELYSRTDPTRVMLGEEQYSWLQDELTTDSSSLMCLTGINALHTIWGGHSGQDWLNEVIDRDRVSADYAGWVKVAADRVLDLISNRDGVVSVYGDVHAGSIVRNKDNRVVECSFGPIGRWGGRSLVNGFGPEMNDFDGRPLDCIALYHHEFKNPQLEKQPDINYWNFLEMEFDSRHDDPEVRIGLRNITDSVSDEIRGGNMLNLKASDIGKQPAAKIKPEKTLPSADLLFINDQGASLRGGRSKQDGTIPLTALVGIVPGDHVFILAIKDDKTHSQSLIATEIT